MIPVLVGFAGLAVDVGFWYMARRGLQTAVDAAAISAAHELANDNRNGARSVAEDDAARNGFDAEGGAIIAVNVPPATGPRAGSNSAAEVLIDEDLPLFFSGLFLSESTLVRVRAVASWTIEDEFCLLVLDPTQSGALDLNDGSRIELRECGLAVNSNSPSAMTMESDTEVRIRNGIAYVVGDISQAGGADIRTDSPPVLGGPPVHDPFAGMNVPPFSGCDFTDTVISDDTTITPGVYCGGLRVTNNSDVDVAPGTYIIDSGDFRIDDISDVEGEGAVFVLASSIGNSEIGSLQIVEHSRFEVTAPTTGYFAGHVIFQDRNAPSTGRNEIAGTSSGSGPAPELRTDGIVYLPAQELWLSDDGELRARQEGLVCPKVVARTVTLDGDARIHEIRCDDDADIPSLGRRLVRLVE